MKPRRQDKQRELEFFDVSRDEAFDLHESDFYLVVRERITQHAKPLLTGEHHILEAGCGTGAFGRYLIRSIGEKAVWNVMGVDIAPAMIAWNERHPQPYYRSQVGDLEYETLFAPETFDAALCPMVLHHFPDPQAALKNISVWLKPGGYLCIVEPNGSSPVNRFSKFIRHCIEKLMGLEYAKRFATVNETDHSMKSYIRWLAQNGLTPVYTETSHPPVSKKPHDWIGWTRRCMYKMTDLLKQPYCGSVIIIIAQNQVHSD